MKNTQDQVLDLFKDEISTCLDKNWKEILLELDYDSFDTPSSDLHDALNKFEQEFNVDLSGVKWSCYFPRENTPMLIRWPKIKREDVEKTCKPLTIRMLAESAKAGKWLYDQQPQAVVITRSVAGRQNNIDD